MSKQATARTRGLPVVKVLTAWTVFIALSFIALVGAALSAGAPSTPRDRAASPAGTLSATDTAHLHYLRSSGSLLHEEGAAHGTLPGNMQASVDIGPTVTASFKIHTNDGTINGHGIATPRGSGTYESFAGSLTVTGGTGRYAHAHGIAGLYGVFDRKTYALTVQTTGKLSL